MALSEDLNAIPRLFGDAVEKLGKLVQNEAQLAKAELFQKITRAGIGAAFIGGAAIFLIPVLALVLMALALWFMQMGISPPTAHLAAAGCGAVICGILALVGISYLKPEQLRPKVTIQQVERDVATVKEFMR